jgi:hypothetical protein
VCSFSRDPAAVAWSQFRDPDGGLVADATAVSPHRPQLLGDLARFAGKASRHERVSVHWWQPPLVYVSVGDSRWEYPYSCRAQATFDLDSGRWCTAGAVFSRPGWGAFLNRLYGSPVRAYSDRHRRPRRTQKPILPLPPDPDIAALLAERQAELRTRVVPGCPACFKPMAARSLTGQAYDELYIGVHYECQASCCPVLGVTRPGRQVAASHGEPYNVDGRSQYELWDGRAWVPVDTGRAEAFLRGEIPELTP